MEAWGLDKLDLSWWVWGLNEAERFKILTQINFSSCRDSSPLPAEAISMSAGQFRAVSGGAVRTDPHGAGSVMVLKVPVLFLVLHQVQQKTFTAHEWQRASQKQKNLISSMYIIPAGYLFVLR